MTKSRISGDLEFSRVFIAKDSQTLCFSIGFADLSSWIPTHRGMNSYRDLPKVIYCVWTRCLYMEAKRRSGPSSLAHPKIIHMYLANSHPVVRSTIITYRERSNWCFSDDPFPVPSPQQWPNPVPWFVVAHPAHLLPTSIRISVSRDIVSGSDMEGNLWLPRSPSTRVTAGACIE